MASSALTSHQTQLFSKKPNLNFKKINPIHKFTSISFITRTPNHKFGSMDKITKMPLRVAAAVNAAADAKVKKTYVEEMRSVAMKLHTKEQAPLEGEKVAKGPEGRSPAEWDPTVEGYLKFLVDNKLVFDTLERIVDESPISYYAEFKNTGLERSEGLAKDLEWFKEQGHSIPEPTEAGITYSNFLEELTKKDPKAFICHFYVVYFAQSAGGRMIGGKISEKILNKKELDFYKWDGNFSQILQNVRNKLNKVTDSWTIEEKKHGLEETAKSYMYTEQILRLILN